MADNPVSIQQLKNASRDAQDLERFVNDDVPALVQTRLGSPKPNYAELQASNQTRFDTFIASSGYQFLGDYAAGVEITEYNQIVRDSDGEFWRLSGQVELPYTTTGAGLPESDSLTPLGDAVLRQQLSQTSGAEMVGLNDPTGEPRTLSELSGSEGSELVGFKQAWGATLLRSVEDKLRESVSVGDFGSVGDGNSHPLSERYGSLSQAQAVYPHATSLSDEIDWAAGQAAINYASVNAIQFPRVVGSHATGTGIAPTILFPRGLYVINRPFVFDASFAYIDLDAQGSLFTPGEGFPAGGFLFDAQRSWTCNFRNIKARMFDNYFRLANDNTGMGHLVLDNIHASGGNVFIDLTARSTLTTVQNFRIDSVKHPLILRAGDIVRFVDGWFIPSELSTDYDGFFKILPGSNNPNLQLHKVFYDPTVQIAKDIVVVRVDAPSSVDISECLFGGEPGQVPLIGWHAPSGNVATGGRGNTIRLRDSLIFSLSSGSATNAPNPQRSAVELYSLPNSVIIDNVAGGSGLGWVSFREDFRSFATAKAESPNANTRIFLEGLVGHFEKIGTQYYANLAQFIRSRSDVSYHVLSDITVDEVPGAHNLVPITGRGNRAYRVCLVSSNSGANTYSEYIVPTRYPNAMQVLPIIEGTDIGAPILFISDGKVYVRTNSDVAAPGRTFNVSVEQIAAFETGQNA